ncbi:Transport protein particle subunit [Lachnellula subtilissima]|uniref:Transport protein particle subunit n=1 Tax=Lachnellula subtilissima TaxID=602034 RepID=A0A8H8U5D5_9HELO|nr:Transport protein particle subunit [Lachnellula subtilissima]
MLDQLSPVAPARVRVVLLPIGQIKRARFLNFVERLQPENVVRLGDISPDGRPHRNMFSPLAFPTGMIVYDLTTFYPPSSHVALSPFELYREPLVFISIGDGAELDRVAYRNPRRSLNGNGAPRPEHNLRELYQDLEDVRDRYPKGLVHQLLLFDYVHPTSAGPLPEGLVAVPPPAQCNITTLKTIMCDISSLLLAEMTTLAKSLQALNTIESPSQSQGSRQHNGTGQADLLSRRNSHISSAAQNSRSESPGDSHDRNHVRMSMPVLRSTDSNASSSSGRPTTPQNSAQTDLPTTFDQIVGPNKSDSTPSQRPISSRLTSTEPVRDISRDRVSVQGFGPGSISERSRNIGKGRIGVVIGSLYLQAGRWGDALRELTEAGAIAKYNLDHLWHAKSLDYILVSMLMLAWTGLDFQIPQICYITEKALLASSSGEPKSPASNRLVSLQNLVVLLPELLDRILNLYARAANNTGEALPQFPFSESAVRFSKLLSVIHLAGGELDDDVLQLLVVSTPFKKATERCLASPSTLGLLGYYRKKAMVMRELVKVLIPGLVHARIKGAAEMGVHPAAGLAALNSINGSTHGAGALDLGEGDVENGVDSFLGLLGQTYGVVSSVDAFGETELHDDSNEAAIARIVKNATFRAFGGQSLKMDVLRSCINFSEALPDFHGVLRFTADLLRTAGSGVAPGPRSDDASPSITREEQVRLATNITRTLGAARSLGVKNIAAEYWDEFLVRGVELEALPFARTPIPHKKNELPGTTAVASSRGIVYLWLARAQFFRVTLQNPYEFDVEIESIKLESEGVIFASSVQKTVIGPYRTQILSVSGTPKGAGQLKITGCIVRVRGCRERRFPIFEEPWSPQSAVKVKTIGVAAIFKPKDRPTSTDSRSTISPTMTPPKTTSIGLNVIERQPVVIVKSNTLSQSAVMVLEGERQRFSVTLENLSKDTPVDLLLFSFKDSTQAPLQTAISNRDASPAELYEYELIFARKQALRWVPKAGEKPHIEPGSTSTFEMEILGKPGLTTATVQVDYAYLGVSPTEVQDDFHTRQVSLPLTITVNASVELARMDILPLTGSIPRSIWTDTQRNKDTKKDITPEDYCLLLLDLRNAWPSHLHIHLEVSDGGMIDEEILPGNTSRIMFPIPRIFLDDPHAGIPALDPSRQRQFVVSAGPVSAESERSSREAFWYREQILKMLHGTWHTKSGPSRNGEIELRGIRLSQRMIEAVKIEEIGIELMVNGATSPKPRHEVFTDSFAEFKVRISNRTTAPIFPMLRVQPSLRNQPHNVSLDLSRKLIWNGILQQALPQIPGKESVEIGIGMTALCRGEFEISASVEEARLKELSLEEGKGSVTRPRANTRAMMDALLGAKERRMWHSREPCLVVVRDEDSSDDDDNE